ncbi:centrin-1-like [Adelges cooleyi]|uniref:centrin-1-like n=1 Tax=Adelges cooleyi TaxID=133065 RepID=UPI002180408B|nr:centrin-1-like [Adelges cooleyi]
MTAAQKAEVSTAFKILDKHGTGEVSTSDVRVALRGLGIEPDALEMVNILGVADVEPCTSAVSYNQFLTIFERVLCDATLTPLDVCRVFSIIGSSYDGRMRAQHLLAAAYSCGLKFTDEQVAEMLAKASNSNNHSCSVEELNEFLSTATMV